ncbi:MCE family protein [Novosphingobium sp. FSY-8]|uniref:MCE family protein n=1 Tax=Novosphingobium ovatum TaxID=1908523 RepID=A0ABW9XDZ7_9SPHN|nr:MlaD family protein [Novosphingobium ovatum]NBC36774.1 MCE family protein [Novosphingobium ovatum]
METRANHVWVGAVTLALLVLAAGVFVWVAQLNRGIQKDYDIYFTQSVDGLARGTPVTYAGVPAGQIKEIEISDNDPGLVRVRIAVNERIPVLDGTTASIQGSFTGVSNIQLSGGRKDAKPITALGPDGAPVIPPKRSGLGALLSNAPLLMERLATLTDRLTLMLSDKNQKSIEGILVNTERLTGHLADASPQVKTVLNDLDSTLMQATITLGEFEKVAGRANAMLDSNGNSLASQLQATLKSAQAAADALKQTADDTRPAARQLSANTLPEAEAALRELRATSRALRELTEKIDAQGISGAMGSPPVPTYKP